MPVAKLMTLEHKKEGISRNSQEALGNVRLSKRLGTCRKTTIAGWQIEIRKRD